jgi:SRSO17 transposase
VRASPLDYKQLKGELGLDHYEGRSWLGWHHHTTLATAAHGFLTLERLHPKSDLLQVPWVAEPGASRGHQS